MEVTYRANANILGHKAGQIYTRELTPQLKALLLTDKHLSLIDPPTLEVKRPEAPATEEIKETETKKKSGRKPVETDKDDDDNGRTEEREESIQDS